MTDNNTSLSVAPNKLTVGFERSVSVRPYETAKASIYVGVDIAGSYNEDGFFVADEGAVRQAADYAFYEARSAVFNQLGIPFDTLDGKAVELLDKHLGPAEIVGTSERSSQGAKAPAQTIDQSKPKTGGKASKDELYADLLGNPGRWWDNREGKRNPKAPDYKHKDSGDGIWLDKAPAEVKEWAASH